MEKSNADHVEAHVDGIELEFCQRTYPSLLSTERIDQLTVAQLKHHGPNTSRAATRPRGA